MAAKKQGYNVWALSDASPAIEPIDSTIAIAELSSQRINMFTWFGLSKALLMQQNNTQFLDKLDSIYSKHLEGFKSISAPAAANKTAPAAANKTAPANQTAGGNKTAPAKGAGAGASASSSGASAGIGLGL